MKICSSCWELNCNCSHRNMIDIDNDIVEQIAMLNKKGYETLFCCAGHKNNKIFEIYVYFKEKVSFQVPIPFKTYRKGHIISFYRDSDKLSDKEINNARMVFKRLVDSLPAKKGSVLYESN